MSTEKEPDYAGIAERLAMEKLPDTKGIYLVRKGYASCMEARLRSDWETIRLLQYWVSHTHRSAETQNALVAHLSKLLEPFT